MADVTLKYKGATIGELSESGSKTIETAGKYCEADILLDYVKPQSGGGLGENLLFGTNYTAGYLDSSGNIATQSSTSKEVTSGNIPVEAEKTYLMLVATATAKLHWVSIQTLDGSGNIVARRIVVVNANVGTNNCGVFYTIPSGVAFVRVSFRTFGNADAYFGEIDIDSIDFENVTQ